MNLAVISDVHANHEALEAVLADIDSRGVKEIVFLGDAVGYGPDPEPCAMSVKQHCAIGVAGNHDRAAADCHDPEKFNPYARYVIEWTKQKMTESALNYLRALPLTASHDDMYLVHSSPRGPEEWDYLTSAQDARGAFYYFSEKLCLIGHSHIPFIVERKPSGSLVPHSSSVEFTEGGKYVINAGSVGQPRDSDPRASYALIGPERAEIVRVGYDIETTRAKIIRAGLPEHLSERLAIGR